MTRSALTILAVVLTTALVPGAAAAQGKNDNAWKFGGRAGFGLEPDQFIIGAHVESPALPQKFLEKVTFRPSFELAFGDEHEVAQVLLEFVMWAPLPDSRWHLYAAAGPGIQFMDNRGALLAVGVGAQHSSSGIFAELRYQNGQARIVGGITLSKR